MSSLVSARASRQTAARSNPGRCEERAGARRPGLRGRDRRRFGHVQGRVLPRVRVPQRPPRRSEPRARARLSPTHPRGRFRAHRGPRADRALDGRGGLTRRRVAGQPVPTLSGQAGAVHRRDPRLLADGPRQPGGNRDERGAAGGRDARSGPHGLSRGRRAARAAFRFASRAFLRGQRAQPRRRGRGPGAGHDGPGDDRRLFDEADAGGQAADGASDPGAAGLRGPDLLSRDDATAGRARARSEHGRRGGSHRARRRLASFHEAGLKEERVSEQVAVEVDSVTKRFGDIKALDGVTLRVRRGEIYGLLGPNGAGKTTLIRSIVGLIAPNSGTVTVLGRKLPNLDVLREVGYMTQQAALYPGLSVEENLRFFAAINGVEGGVKDALEFVDLYARRGSVVSTLSGGMRQRCSLACALVHRPQLLLLDEPTVGVDPQLRAQFWKDFRRMADGGTTIIVSSHVMDEAERCERLGLIQYGRVLAEGTPGEIRAMAGSPNLEDAFLKLAGTGVRA